MHTIFKKIFLLLATTFCMCTGSVYASHYAAADITVDYIGTSQNDLTYKITLSIYKACEPGNADLATAENIHIGSVNAGFNVTWLVFGGQLDTLDQLCDFAKPQNSCRVPASLWPAFVRRIYDTTITLPSRQVDWTFFWTNSARNAGISNLVNPANSIYIEAGINNVFGNNSAPRFLVDPLPYICVNRPAFYLNGPFDPDNDSLEVVHTSPLLNATTAYAFKGPSYSFANPIASTTTNPYTVNPSTGTATFTPTLTGLHVLAFRCNEYQKGTGIPTGHVLRDVQLTILNCSADPPDIDSIPANLAGGVNVSNTAQGSTIVSCPNITISFEINASSKSNSNKVLIEANNATIPTSTFVATNNGTPKATGAFSWTPTNNDYGDHTLIITAKDSTCNNTQPIVLKNYRVFLIKIIKGIDAGPDLTLCANGGVAKEIFVRNSDGLNLAWTPATGLDDATSHAPMAKPVVTTEYVVTASNLPDGCKSRDTIVVNVDTSNSVQIFPDNPVLCKPDYLQLEALTKGRPPLTNMACGTSSPVNCAIPDSLGIYSLLPGDFDTLGGSTPTFAVDVKTSKQQFLVRKSEMWESGLMSATIRSISFMVAQNADPTYLYSNFRISMMCTTKDALSRTNGFEVGTIPVYTSTSDITLAQGWHKFDLNVPYNWDTSKNIVIEICYSNNATVGTASNNPIIKFVATGYPSSLTLKSSTATTVCATNTSTAIGENYARPLFGFTYCESPAAPFVYTWIPSVFLSDSTIRQPLAYVPKSARYTVQTVGRSGCIMSDTTDIYIPEHHYTITPADTAICFGEAAPLHVRGGGFAYKWYKLDDNGNYQLLYNPTNKEATCYDCADPVLSPEKTTIYKIAVYDSVWCIDTLTAKVTVLPLPDIRIISRDTVIKYGQSLQLLASGAKLYNWMPVGSLNNANISYPVATPAEPTTYIAGGIGSNGCRAFDTVKVGIDYRDNLFIPSAFSPNGDGKNDVFKVSNLTFQKIAEFRVFNRWGQEVFMANDNTGWDGNWKGEPQDMGTYTYSIKIGFPDGYVESYRGNVTLIR